ncbi:MAG: hypothetical protein COW65_04410 [Cytophagales bacterium CG18_big_fil_WC_8_21_14_2_50_42_9]|nr:MAG: hypothetical protein COW65_04410 [Cytophagales bacterium CG18_big_fil_WC_8_21_14_2_50_42_9]
MKYFFLFLLSGLFLAGTSGYAQTSAIAKAAPADSIMITIFLKHQQDKSLKEIQKKQEENKLWEQFPPKEARVISWYVMMGIGQVVTVKIPAHALRTLNLSIENGAWGAFNTEFYPTYDYVPVWKNSLKNKK